MRVHLSIPESPSRCPRLKDMKHYRAFRKLYKATEFQQNNSVVPSHFVNTDFILALLGVTIDTST
jgi:hypothetical protein